MSRYGQGRTFLPLGFTLFGALSEGTTELLSRVADAAHQQGYVGEVWGTLKGDRVRAIVTQTGPGRVGSGRPSSGRAASLARLPPQIPPWVIYKAM